MIRKRNIWYIISRFGIQEKGENCLYSSTRNVLYFHGLRLTEPEVYFAFNGVNSVFYPALQKYGFLDIIEHLENHLLPDHLIIRRGTPGPSIGKELYSIIRRDLPVSLVMRAKDATYSKTLVSSGASGRHVSVLYGLDLERDEVYMWDNYILDKIRNVSHYSGASAFSKLQPGILEYFWIEVFSREPIDFSALLCRSLSGFLEGKAVGGTVTGEQGLLAYLNSLSAFLQDAKSLRDKSYEIYFTLRVSTYEAFLSALVQILKKIDGSGIPGYSGFLLEGERLRKKWDTFAVQLLRFGMKNQPENVQRLLLQLPDMACNQESYFRNLMCKLLDSGILLNPKEGSYYSKKAV